MNPGNGLSTSQKAITGGIQMFTGDRHAVLNVNQLFLKSVNSSDVKDGIIWLCGSVNTLPADALALKVTRVSAGMVLTV